MSIQDDRSIELAAHALHDSLVRVPGGSRILRHGIPIKPFGCKLAAQILGKSPADVQNMADPRKLDHQMHLDKYHKLLLEGLDPAWLDEVEHSIGRVAFKVPEAVVHHDLSQELMHAIAEFGDVGKCMGEVLVDGVVTVKEMHRFEREVDEAIAAIVELREALREKVE